MIGDSWTQQDAVKELKRISALLDDWIAAAQSGDNMFGRLLQEPTPARLREAIKASIEGSLRLQQAEFELHRLRTQIVRASKALQWIADPNDQFDSESKAKCAKRALVAISGGEAGEIGEGEP